MSSPLGLELSHLSPSSNGESYEPKLAVIGAGIAGVVLSIALVRQNPALKVSIYEQKEHISEVGVGLGFGPNAATAMKLICPELGEAYKKLITLNGDENKIYTDFDIYGGDKEEKGEYLGEMLAREALRLPAGGASRVAFLNLLFSLVPDSVNIIFSKKVADVKKDLDGGAMKLSFTDGVEIIADAVIGCDGIRSTCRKIMLGENHEAAKATYTGKYAYRAIIPMGKATAAIGPIARTRRLIAGHGRHILFFPVQHGRGLNVAAFLEDEKPWTDQKWVVPATQEDILRGFEGFDDTSIKLLKLIETTDKWALFDHPPAPTYVGAAQGGRFCLLGDAAHAATPHCGAGAGMAVEDAYILSSLMRPEFIHCPADIKYAFQAYDAIRRPRTLKLVERSRRQGSVFCLRLTDAHSLKDDFEHNMKWIWDVDFDEMLCRAKESFASLKAQDTAAGIA